MKCTQCNKENEEGAKFCSNCGFNFVTQEEVPTPTGFPFASSKMNIIGSTLGDRFLIMEQVAKGGMGFVFKAKDLILEETVALKVLKPDLAIKDEMISRFKREIKVARKIKHPNVCSIYDFGTFDDYTFISMEFLEGNDLGKFIKDGMLPDNVWISIIRGILEGLEAAHGEEIIHRDLKPSNIIVDSQFKPVILDFGIARFVGRADLTMHKEVLGTPTYMAPEQFHGENIDQRSDIYSLGVIMYEIFTGKKPFEADTPLAVAMKHHKEPPVPPREVVEYIPEHIEKIILKCLEKNPEDRFQNASEILEALDEKALDQPLEEEKVKILVADDDSAVRDLLVFYLDKNGYDIIIAKNGEEAVAKSIEEKPSLILMDLMMPGMDGLQATEILKKNAVTSAIPVIMITAKDDREYKAYVKSIGITEYVTKPIDIHAVLDKVKNIIPVP